MPEVTAADVVHEALTWRDTPFHHQGRLKGIGVDCAGVITRVANALGVSDFDTTDYPRVPDSHTLKALCDEHMDREAAGPDCAERAAPGMVILIRFGRHPHHLAIRTFLGIVHAYQFAGRVIETSYDFPWRRRTVGVYRYRGVSY